MTHIGRSLVTVVAISFFILPNTYVSAQAPDTLWAKIYDRGWDDRAYSIQQTPDSGYIIAASTGPNGSTHDIWLLRTDAYGDTLWTKTYGGINDDRSQELQLTTDGGFIIAAATASFGAGDYDVWLLKTDSLGDTLWTRTYGGEAFDHGLSVKQTPDGGFIIAGPTRSFGAGDADVWLLKTDSLGDTLWTRTYGGIDFDAAIAVQLTSDKEYILAGITRSFNIFSSLDAYLIKTDSLGEMLWTRTYGGAGDDFFESVQQTFDGGYIMTGFVASYGNAGDLYLIKTDENGDTLWTRHWGNAHNMDYGYSVIQIPDSNYIVAGYYSNSTGTDHYTDVWILKVSDAGDTLWTAKYARFSGDTALDDWTYSVQRTFDGGYILAGKTGFWVRGDIYLIRLAPDTVGVEENHITHPPLLNLEVCPNPFSEKTDIRFQIRDNIQKVDLKLHDISGRLVKALPCPPPNALCPRLITWDGRDNAGEKLPSGVYYLRLETEDNAITRKVLLLR